MMTREDLAAAQQAHVDTVFNLGSTALDGVVQLVELNMRAAKTSLDEAAQSAVAALSAKDLQELLELQSSLLQPAATQASAYARHVQDIAMAVFAEANRVAEAQLAQAQKAFAAWLERVAQNTPPGSASVLAVVQSAAGAAADAYENVQRAGREVSEAAENGITAVTDAAVDATETSSRRKRTP